MFISRDAFLILIAAAYGITILIAWRVESESSAGMYCGFMLWLGWPIVFAIILGVNHYIRFGH